MLKDSRKHNEYIILQQSSLTIIDARNLVIWILKQDYLSIHYAKIKNCQKKTIGKVALKWLERETKFYAE